MNVIPRFKQLDYVYCIYDNNIQDCVIKYVNIMANYIECSAMLGNGNIITLPETRFFLSIQEIADYYTHQLNLQK